MPTGDWIPKFSEGTLPDEAVRDAAVTKYYR
jgi:hypothetical protein